MILDTSGLVPHDIASFAMAIFPFIFLAVTLTQFFPHPWVTGVQVVKGATFNMTQLGP